MDLPSAARQQMVGKIAPGDAGDACDQRGACHGSVRGHQVSRAVPPVSRARISETRMISP
jgi:hypothetical protein